MKKLTAAAAATTLFLFASYSLAQAAEPGHIFSFRGVLAGILKNIEEGAQSVASAVRNPFSNDNASKAQTSTSAGEEKTFSFAIIGDTQSFSAAKPDGYFQKVVKNIAAAKPDLVFSTGDLVSSGDNYTDYSKKFSEWKKIQSPLLSKTYAAMGNHDNAENKGVKAWQEAFDFPTNGPAGYSELAYSFDFKNSHFVILDSDSPEPHEIDNTQKSWLEQDLFKNKKENIFVFFHEPAYPVSSKIGESLDKQSSDRDALWQIFEKHGVTAVFSGHEHIVSRRKIGNVYQFVLGDTDSFNHDLPEDGIAEYANQGQGRFGIVSVNGKEITIKTLDSDNEELDSFTFSR